MNLADLNELYRHMEWADALVWLGRPTADWSLNSTVKMETTIGQD